MPDDCDLLAAELLRALRGTRSQVSWSRRLGYRTNVAYLWESGRRFPPVSAFLHAVRRAGIDPAAAVGRFAGKVDPAVADPASASGFAAVLDGLRGTTTVSAVARRMSRARAPVARWLAGTAEPRLPDLIRLAEALTDRKLDFVAAFVDPATVPSAGAEWSRLLAARALARATPWASAVMLALELEAYRALPAHESGWLAARLGIPVEVEVESLELLARSGHVAWRGTRWEPVAVDTLNVRNPGEASGTPLRSFWAGVARERLDAGADGLLAWNLGAVSTRDLERVRDLQRRAFREMRAIIAASEGAEHLVLVSWALADLTRTP